MASTVHSSPRSSEDSYGASPLMMPPPCLRQSRPPMSVVLVRDTLTSAATATAAASSSSSCSRDSVFRLKPRTSLHLQNQRPASKEEDSSRQSRCRKRRATCISETKQDDEEVMCGLKDSIASTITAGTAASSAAAKPFDSPMSHHMEHALSTMQGLSLKSPVTRVMDGPPPSVASAASPLSFAKSSFSKYGGSPASSWQSTNDMSPKGRVIPSAMLRTANVKVLKGPPEANESKDEKNRAICLNMKPPRHKHQGSISSAGDLPQLFTTPARESSHREGVVSMISDGTVLSQEIPRPVPMQSPRLTALSSPAGLPASSPGLSPRTPLPNITLTPRSEASSVRRPTLPFLPGTTDPVETPSSWMAPSACATAHTPSDYDVDCGIDMDQGFDSQGDGHASAGEGPQDMPTPVKDGQSFLPVFDWSALEESSSNTLTTSQYKKKKKAQSYSLLAPPPPGNEDLNFDNLLNSDSGDQDNDSLSESDDEDAFHLFAPIDSTTASRPALRQLKKAKKKESNCSLKGMNFVMSMSSLQAMDNIASSAMNQSSTNATGESLAASASADDTINQYFWPRIESSSSIDIPFVASSGQTSTRDLVTPPTMAPSQSPPPLVIPPRR